eukprot:COSAG02_NODE_9085_length_2336_cov_2.589629_4_plen_245_part_00
MLRLESQGRNNVLPCRCIPNGFASRYRSPSPRKAFLASAVFLALRLARASSFAPSVAERPISGGPRISLPSALRATTVASNNSSSQCRAAPRPERGHQAAIRCDTRICVRAPGAGRRRRTATPASVVPRRSLAAPRCCRVSYNVPGVRGGTQRPEYAEYRVVHKDRILPWARGNFPWARGGILTEIISPMAISAFTSPNRPFPGCELDVPRLATPRGPAGARARAREHAESELSTVVWGFEYHP